jgi:general secretion pathway protein D
MHTFLSHALHVVGCRPAIAIFLLLVFGSQPTLAQPATEPADDDAAHVPTAADPASGDSSRITSAETSGGEGDLVMHFRDAPLQEILNYLSEQAGLVVVSDIDLQGDRITVFNLQPVKLETALQMLNTVLFEKGFTAVRRGPLVKVVALGDAKTQSVPVRLGNDPDAIGQSDSLITQVIPIRYADADALVENLTPLISPEYAQLSANQSSNSLILTDTEANVKRLVRIVAALDQSISQVTEVRVFLLTYADAESIAELIEETFAVGPSEDEIVARAMQRRFGRRGRGGEDDDEQASSGAQGREVTASADERTNSVVISAGPEIMLTIASIIEDLDVDTTAKESVLIYSPKNMQAIDLADTFNRLFLGVSTSSTNDGIGNTRTNNNNRNAGGGNNNRNNGGNNNRNPGGGGRGAATAVLAATGDPSAADLVGQVSSVANEATNTLLVLTQEKNFAKVNEILAALDRAVPQVLIRVLVSEMTYDDSLDLGVEFETLNVGTSTDDNLLSNFNLLESTLGLNYLFFRETDFRLAVRALQATGRFDVLSRPYLLTNDNQEASITVGQEVPFPINQRTTDDGDTVSDIDYRDVGIILTVTPQINDEGLVVLDLTQELSALTDQTIPISGDFNAVVVNKRELTTQVAVGSGQTVVVGGLIQDQLQENVSKVPLLGDLPLIGNLFRRTQSTKTKTELLLFLTPEVITSAEQLSESSQRIKNDAAALDHAVEAGMLQKHLDQMKVETGEAEPPAAPEPEPTPRQRSLDHLGEALD